MTVVTGEVAALPVLCGASDSLASVDASETAEGGSPSGAPEAGSLCLFIDTSM